MKKLVKKISFILFFIFFISCNDKIELIEPIASNNEVMDTSTYRLINLGKFKSFHQSIIKLESSNYSYQDEERKKFKRFPGNRNGVQIYKLSSEQRIQLHDLLNDLLSPKGYLKILSILSNEDAPARTDDELGRKMYWLTFFGEPNTNQLWGFRFEGHHISLNFSFKGNLLISSSPTVYGAFPSIMQKGEHVALTDDDFFREGLNTLFEEEDKGLDLIASFDSLQYNKSFSNLISGIDIIGEDNQIYDLKKLYTSAFDDQGILFSDLNDKQQILMSELINCYFTNFAGSTYLIDNLKVKETKFIIFGEFKKNAKFYYRIINEDFIIEFQNIRNHIHCLFRDFRNDFGNTK